MEELARHGLRVLRFLLKGPASLFPAADDSKMLLEAPERGSISLSVGALNELVAQGLLSRSEHDVCLSPKGSELARKLDQSTRPSAMGSRDLGLVPVETPGGRHVVLTNLSESPLAQLVRMKTKSGKRFLAAMEFEAGERLRADYTRGRLMPRLGANWVASVASGKRTAAGGAVDLTDAALGARLRVEGALTYVGPELSGVLVDVCCFLKGLEQVEMERGWPVRSAKVLLKTALGVLARHYFPECRAEREPSRTMLHWGTEDYRPSMSA